MIAYNARLPRVGLRTLFDPANRKSAPTSGASWTDVVSGGTMTLSNQTWSSNYGGIFQFAAAGGAETDDDSLFDYRSIDHTIIVFSRKAPGGADVDGRILTANANNWLLGHHGSYWGAYYAGAWIYNPTSNTTGADQWRMYAAQGSPENDVWSLWIDLTLQIDMVSTGVAGPWGLAIGQLGYANQGNDNEVSAILAYDRWLVPGEIAQVFQCFRGRFGI